MTAIQGTVDGAPMSDSMRIDALRTHGASDADCRELLAYNANRFVRPAELPALPLADEPFVQWWIRRSAESVASSAGEVVARFLPELRDVPLTSLELTIHPTPAGRLPILTARDRTEFEALVATITRRTTPVPASMGASMVGGFRNVHRQAEVRASWARTTAGDTSDAAFAAYLKTPEGRARGFDRFVILSRGPYSGVDASALGLDAHTWLDLSHTIRLEHECAHYFTRRVLGTMTNAVLDELLADYAGIGAAAGKFNASWFLEFMGLAEWPTYRSGGRLENYRGSPPLSDSAFNVLANTTYFAAWNVAEFDGNLGESRDLTARAAALLALARWPIEGLAMADAPSMLQEAYAQDMAALSSAAPG